MKQNKPDKASRTFALPEHLWAELHAVAAGNTRSLTGELERAIRKHLGDEDPLVRLTRERDEARSVARQLLYARSDDDRGLIADPFDWFDDREEAEE